MVSQNPHEKESDESIASKLRLHFAQQALASVLVDRDEQDSYSIRIASNGKDLSLQLTDADVVVLLPTGSRWVQAVGWHSYFGIPFSFDGKMWLAIGAEVIKRHHSRGAYVSFFAFIFPFYQPPTHQLAQFANELYATQPKGVHDKPSSSQSMFFQNPLKFIAGGLGKLKFPSNRYRVIKANSITPSEHAQVEAYIIREAVESYNKNELLLFRTLILSENQLERRMSLYLSRPKKKIIARLQIRYYKYLAATIPAIKGTFSSQARYV